MLQSPSIHSPALLFPALSSQLWKKPLFSLQGVGGKNGREGRRIQVPFPLQVSCSKEKPYFLC